MSKPLNDNSLADVPGELIKELLTPSELRMIRHRLLIIDLLEEGLSIRRVAEDAKVGTDTVVRVARKLESNPIIREYLKKPSKKSSSNWVFGKTDNSR